MENKGLEFGDVDVVGSNVENFDDGDTKVAPLGEFKAEETLEEKVKEEKPIENKKEIAKKIRCSKCNSAQTYILKDLTRICRKCGFRDNKSYLNILNK